MAVVDADDAFHDRCVRALMTKYGDLPMDLADAALVRVADRESLHAVFTIDQADFGVYRLPGGRRFRLLP
ncbi:MAG: hypothetical protein HY824_16495 [Acidobacteria bacterium]|nr:hypothetical protein [Acidobacteriota bacterium]